VLGTGHFQQGSIMVRMLLFGDRTPEPNFWSHRLLAALKQRYAADLPNSITNAFRIIHAEGDGLPGLIIDYYDGTAVVQAHSMGMHLDRTYIATALCETLKENLKAIYYKSQTTLAKVAPEEKHGYLFGMSAVPHVVQENGARFLVDWETGQKTGFFLDQRDNRALLSQYAQERRVLNTFCYTGGFSVYALTGGATLVHSVDSSARAVELTSRNIELNGFDPVKHYAFASDTFEFMKDKDGQYNLIVLDPPAFAKHKDARHQAIKGYQRLNAEAFRIIDRGGILFTFSCSQVVDRKLFHDTVVSAAIQVGRSVRVLHHLSQPADHPVSLFHPEGEYLKGLVLYVD
jgi:23S rRNA (cytosine1962-C5)-methyltransferase